MAQSIVKTTTYTGRLPLLSWILLPLLILWLSVGYVIGLTKPIAWENGKEPVKAVYMYEDPKTPEFIWEGTGLVTLWFDDAWYSQYSVAFPIMEEYGMKGALAVPSGLINYDEYMSWPQVQRMQHKGWEITSHSVNHVCEADKLDGEAVLFEMKQSLATLREHNLQIQTYVAPCGYRNASINTTVKEYYLSMRTTDEGLNALPVTDPYNLKILAITDQTTIATVNEWLTRAKEEESWLIIVFHPLSEDSSAYGATPAFFREILQAVQVSELPVVVPSQALQVTE